MELFANVLIDLLLALPRTGNGYIEGHELDNFLREFITSVSAGEIEVSVLFCQPNGPRFVSTILLNHVHSFWFIHQSVSEGALAEIRQCFMDAYDDNKDGKIEIREVSEMYKIEQRTGSETTPFSSRRTATVWSLEHEF